MLNYSSVNPLMQNRFLRFHICEIILTLINIHIFLSNIFYKYLERYRIFL